MKLKEKINPLTDEIKILKNLTTELEHLEHKLEDLNEHKNIN